MPAGAFANGNGPASSAAGAQTGEWTFLAGRQRTFGGGVNYTFGPATAGFVYTQTNLGDTLGGGISSTQSGKGSGVAFNGNSARFQNFEGNIRYDLTPCTISTMVRPRLAKRPAVSSH